MTKVLRNVIKWSFLATIRGLEYGVEYSSASSYGLNPEAATQEVSYNPECHMALTLTC